MTRVEADVNLQENRREAHGSQGGQVVSEPPAGGPENQDGQDGGRPHDRQLDRQPVRQLRHPRGHRDAAEDDANTDQNLLLPEHVGRQMRLPQPVGDARDDGAHGEAVDQGKVPRAGGQRGACCSPCRPEQRIGRRGLARVFGQVRRTITFGTLVRCQLTRQRGCAGGAGLLS